MEKDNLTIYWSPVWEPISKDWTFLYPKPKTLFSSTKEHDIEKTYDSSNSNSTKIFSCPAVSGKFKKIIVFESPMSCSYQYDFFNFMIDGSHSIKPETKEYISYNVIRKSSIDYGPSIDFSLRYIFFSEESLDAYFTPPMFHPPKYIKYGSVIPGEFNIGKWFRPYNFEVQMWNKTGNFILEEKEPLFYVEFKTDKKIILKRFNMTEKLNNIVSSCIESDSIFGIGRGLEKRYEKFESTDMRDIVLNEIKHNLVFESKPIEV